MSSQSIQATDRGTAQPSLGIFYGSTSGTTELVATKIRGELGDLVTQFENVRKAQPGDLQQHDFLLLGISTWNVGDMQDDWFEFLPRLSELNLTGTTIGLFAAGDSYGYPYTFLDAMGKLWAGIQQLGAPTLAGTWPVHGYEFEESEALHDENHFVGLGIDHDNQPECTDDRITVWVEKFRQETGLESLHATASKTTPA